VQWNKTEADGEYEGNTVIYSLSELGRSILGQSAKRKQLEIARSILQYEVFYRVMDLHLCKSQRPSIAQVIEIMHRSNLNIGLGTTIPRRAQTVLAWIDWILSLQHNMDN